MPESEYAQLLEKVSSTRGEIAAVLAKAQKSRTTMLRRYGSGGFFSALNQLLEYLTAAKNTYDCDTNLARISFLLARARDDFEVAIEGTLSRAPSVVADQMRDVMEIHFLLRDFSADPTRIKEWLTATHKERLKHFSPSILRQRHAKRLGKKPQDLPETKDYEVHSEALHVTPMQNAVARKGFSGDQDELASRICIAEMFHHARRLIAQIVVLKRRIAPQLKLALNSGGGVRTVRFVALMNKATQAVLNEAFGSQTLN
jgi:hypothetical protein